MQSLYHQTTGNMNHCALTLKIRWSTGDPSSFPCGRCWFVLVSNRCSRKNQPSEPLKANLSSESKFKCYSVPKKVLNYGATFPTSGPGWEKSPLEWINITVKINQNVTTRTSRLNISKYLSVELTVIQLHVHRLEMWATQCVFCVISWIYQQTWLFLVVWADQWRLRSDQRIIFPLLYYHCFNVIVSIHKQKVTVNDNIFPQSHLRRSPCAVPLKWICWVNPECKWTHTKKISGIKLLSKSCCWLLT